MHVPDGDLARVMGHLNHILAKAEAKPNCRGIAQHARRARAILERAIASQNGENEENGGKDRRKNG